MDKKSNEPKQIASNQRLNLQFNYYIMRYLWTRIPDAKVKKSFHDTVESSRQRIVSIINTGIVRYYSGVKSDIVDEIGIPLGILEGVEAFFDYKNNDYIISVGKHNGVKLADAIAEYFSYRNTGSIEWESSEVTDNTTPNIKTVAKWYEKGINAFIIKEWNKVSKNISNPDLPRSAFNSLCYYIKHGERRNSQSIDERLDDAVHKLQHVCSFEQLENCSTEHLNSSLKSIKAIYDDMVLITKYRGRKK